MMDNFDRVIVVILVCLLLIMALVNHFDDEKQWRRIDILEKKVKGN